MLGEGAELDVHVTELFEHALDHAEVGQLRLALDQSMSEDDSALISMLHQSRRPPEIHTQALAALAIQAKARVGCLRNCAKSLFQGFP